ncbi:MAG: hypothetical protein KDC04_02880 [Saprospiraceae bacterium]|nr:hypothetical protein [Saprospiraceae bacterium]
MNFYNFPQVVFTLILATSICTFAQSQDTKEAVILYNTAPVLAHISKDGEVYNIIREEPDFLKGFVLQIPDYEQYLLSKAPLADATPKKTDEPLVKETVENQKKIKKLPTSHYDILDYSLGGFNFSKDQATLNSESIDLLNRIITYKTTNPQKKIHFILKNDNQNDNKLFKNRANAIVTYLKLRGFPTSDITFLDNATVPTDFVEFYIVK